MLGIVAYALGAMYSPGPVNLLGLNIGINGQARQSVGFCLGVGTAMLAYLLVLGWAGAAWIDDETLIVVSALGCAYIVYLASKIARSSVDISEPDNAPRLVSYRDGLVMQLLNPKAILATLPIATLQFPAADIHGLSLVFWAFGLSMLAAGAPGSYIVIGSVVGSRIKNPGVVKGFNWLMAALLVAVALSIGVEHVWAPLTARN
ncbi:LysE family transporter [Halomonas sp. QX-2]|jgi:threonine/homoserine/homoserine lactone efflux protein|uniref:LysE family transporter n=1 Tax=Vreelandella sedimenti TaxID=2729618 RepID=A0A7Z0SL81_9GAMM|nr:MULTISPECIES: LysE family transporter [Halomonas]NYT72187.1 LysE family transporter [Halomonas sedimenti]|tara:strand:+ start:11335 stop:11946 length:612 start_codon:yes stop_codon:yes gene_type:complete